MEDQLVSFKVASLAKEKGFINNSSSGYERYLEDYEFSKHFATECHKKGEIRLFNVNVEEDDLVTNSSNYFGDTISNTYEAPTQSLLQKWLRENHQIFVSASYNHILCNGTYFTWYGIMKVNCNMIEHFNSYEQALDEGLFKALNLIKL